jgi:diguanylate cyclase (GGDEF)-like protein
MKELIRSTDILGRWGGEEFMIISPNTDLNGAYTLTQNIRSNIENTIFDSVNKVTISAGIAQINSNLDEKSIITKADEALYRAKDNGRNRVEK